MIRAELFLKKSSKIDLEMTGLSKLSAWRFGAMIQGQ